MSFQKSSGAKNKSSQDSIDRHLEHVKMISELRDMALGQTPANLRLNISSDKQVYGIVMDWHVKNGIVTLTSFQTGEASMYTKGQCVLGGIHTEKINEAAKTFVLSAQSCLTDAVHTDLTPLPGSDEVIFYLLTTKGIFAKTLTINLLRSTSSNWVNLFDKANYVIHEYDVATRDRRKK
jgi:hypothetical protein